MVLGVKSIVQWLLAWKGINNHSYGAQQYHAFNMAGSLSVGWINELSLVAVNHQMNKPD